MAPRRARHAARRVYGLQFCSVSHLTTRLAHFILHTRRPIRRTVGHLKFQHHNKICCHIPSTSCYSKQTIIFARDLAKLVRGSEIIIIQSGKTSRKAPDNNIYDLKPVVEFSRVLYINSKNTLRVVGFEWPYQKSARAAYALQSVTLRYFPLLFATPNHVGPGLYYNAWWCLSPFIVFRPPGETRRFA